MRQLILAVRINSGHDYCTAINESEAIEVLQCMNDLGIKACLEYDNIPFQCDVPKHFDWTAFILTYRKLLKHQHLI